MMCSPFLRGFLPGICVGLCTSLLFLSLWRPPSNFDNAAQETERRETPKRAEDRETATDRRDGVPSDIDADLVGKLGDAAVSGNFVLLILVHSSAEQRSLRDSLRATWLRQRSRRDEYVARFVIGSRSLGEEALASLAEESREHKDLLMLPDVEEEANAEWSSSEKLLRAFSWALAHVNFTAVFKCNSATFADLDKLLAKFQPQRRHVWGYFAGGVKAVRDSENSPLTEEGWVLCSHYLPFPQGGGYVISRDLIELIVTMGPDLNRYRHDDIALGVWLSPLKGVTKQHSLGFNTGHYSRGCLNTFIVSHRESEESMAAKALSLETRGLLCGSEYQSRLAYHFNWTAPASRCCVRKAGVY